MAQLFSTEDTTIQMQKDGATAIYWKTGQLLSCDSKSTEDNSIAIHWRQHNCYLLKIVQLLSNEDSTTTIYWKTGQLLLVTAELLSTEDGSIDCYLLKIVQLLSNEDSTTAIYWKTGQLLLVTAELLSTEDGSIDCYLLKIAQLLSTGRQDNLL